MRTKRLCSGTRTSATVGRGTSPGRLSLRSKLPSFSASTNAPVAGWMANYRRHGDRGLAAKQHLTVLPNCRVNNKDLCSVGCRRIPSPSALPPECGPARRVAQVIQRKFGVFYHPRYISEWLTGHNFTPQKPQKHCPTARERNDQTIDNWIKTRVAVHSKRARRQRRHLVMSRPKAVRLLGMGAAANLGAGKLPSLSTRQGTGKSFPDRSLDPFSAPRPSRTLLQHPRQ